MTKTNLQYLIANTDLFSKECILKNSMAISESELKSIITRELKNMEENEIDTFISSLLDLYKNEILRQDKIAYRSIVQEIKAEDIKYIVEHKHPRGRFITVLNDNTAMYVSTISDLSVEYYTSKNEMLADIILKQCFSINYNAKENQVTIKPTVSSADYIFSKEILLYIKNNMNDIAKEILNRNALLTYKNQNNYDLFKDYLKTTVLNIFDTSKNTPPKNINIGDTIQTKYSDNATVIDIDTENQTLKLDKEIQNEITVFTNVISYKNEDIITKIISPQEDMEMEE